MKTIKMDGTYILQLMKNENGEFSSAIILQKNKTGITPVLDFPVKTIQVNQNIGIELEFNSADIFTN